MSTRPEEPAGVPGRHVVITGATGGLGSQLADELAAGGARLTLAVRNLTTGAALMESLTTRHPGARIALVELDLADLASAHRAANQLLERGDGIDVLINNAGIMVPPLARTADGFELQMGSNHLGHFAWTAQLWPLLRNQPARIVTVSSLAHSLVRGIDFTALTLPGSPRRYRRWAAYGQSKLANLLFAMELDRRGRAAGLSTVSVAAHPGIAVTQLTTTGASMGGLQLPWKLVDRGARVIGQSAAGGAQPLLRAATDASLGGGEFVGPGGYRQLHGSPSQVGMSRAARDEQLAARLWRASEDAAGLRFEA